MGRKPNALILQHFERGAKLNDSSNRYQHTCKSCGEKFPKGRIDSLTAHLLNKCPALPKSDRQRARLELSNKLQASQQANANHGEVQMNGATVDLPIVNRTWSALETLAEAARHSDLNENHPQQEQGHGGGMGPHEPSRADRLELQEQYTLDNPPVSYEQRVQRDRKEVGNQKPNRRGSELSLSPAAFAAALTNSRSSSPNLAMAASSIAAAAAARFIPSMVDPQLLEEEANAQHDMTEKAIEQHLTDANASMQLPDHFFSSVPDEQPNNWPIIDNATGSLYPEHEQDHLDHTSLENSEPQQGGPYPRIAMNSGITTQFTSEFGTNHKISKPKPRSRFQPDRRKEVQSIRKLGACIRCRMLKKTCSEGTPCKTCKSVDSARVWKQGCIRTRLADDLDMYSAGLHSVLSFREVNQAKSHTLFQSSTHKIEASHYPDTTVFTMVDALESQLPSGGSIDPGLSGDFSTNTLLIVDNGKDDLQAKMEAYMKSMLHVFIDREVSSFMKITLNTAQQRLAETQDSLLSRVLELWATVHILVDHELTWKIFDRPDHVATPGQGPSIDHDTGNGTYAIICLQLNAAAEKKAAELCKSVLGDLERRLLNKSSNQSFEIFLFTLILLNCIEKSSWLFKSWEQESFAARWPLDDKKPEHFIQQAEKVASLIHSLLKIRHIIPDVIARPEDGVLVAKSGLAVEYYQQLNLTYVEVFNQLQNPVFEQSDSRCYELRFCSRLLLPQT